MKERKEIQASEVFTPEMLELAMKCRDKDEILEKVITPNMEHINKVTEQENDPRYWAYALEFVLMEIKSKAKKEKLQ
jgi:hypothetical protein